MKSVFVLLSIALLSLIMAACSNSSSSKTAAAEAKPRGGIGSEACKNKGGRWVRGGTLMFYGCLLPAPDAGKSCTHSNQCKYQCNANPADTRRTGQPATGSCQRNNSYTGCQAEIKDGIVQPTFCVKI